MRLVLTERGRSEVLDAVAAAPAPTLRAVRRHGKQLALDFDTPFTFQLHLGMSGRVEPTVVGGSFPRHTRFVWLLMDGRGLAFVDQRRFARFGLRTGDPDPLDFSGLGPDALEADLDQWARALARPAPVKPSLLDQGRLAGVGNIYACEGLYAAGVDPRTPCDALAPETIAGVRAAVVASMNATLTREGEGPMRYVNEGHVVNPFAVYGRAGEPCPRCAQSIERFTQAGRSTFWCSACQRG